MPHNRLSSVTARSPRERLPSVTRRYTYVCTPGWERGGSRAASCRAGSTLRPRRPPHVRADAADLQQELHRLLRACRRFPSLHAGHRYVRLRPATQAWEGSTALQSPGVVQREDIEQNSEEGKLLPPDPDLFLTACHHLRRPQTAI